MRSTSSTDRQLLIAATKGEEAAFAELFARYRGRLLMFFYQRVGRDRERAQDLVQQTFLQLLESKAFANPTSGPPSLDKFIFSIASNVLKNFFRSEKRKANHLAVYQQEALISHEDRPQEEAPALTPKILEQLNPAHREAIELKFQDGLTLDEISTVLDCPRGTVKSRIHYGLRKLAKLLKPKSITS